MDTAPQHTGEDQVPVTVDIPVRRRGDITAREMGDTADDTVTGNLRQNPAVRVCR
jgi:hypothetical protein